MSDWHTIPKRILVPARVRRPPSEGWSWIDRRFVREHAPRLDRNAILLYFFLAAVSDRHGLSYWRDETIGGRLKLEVRAVTDARDELVRRDLVAHEAPLTQVLSLPAQADPPRRGLRSLAGILRDLSASDDQR